MTLNRVDVPAQNTSNPDPFCMAIFKRRVHSESLDVAGATSVSCMRGCVGELP